MRTWAIQERSYTPAKALLDGARPCAYSLCLIFRGRFNTFHDDKHTFGRTG